MRENQIVMVNICEAEMSYIRSQSVKAEIGGKSHVRSEDRMAELGTDQLVGQVGTYAGHKYWLGNSSLYRVSRWYANIHPHSGDGGSDLPGANIDFKSSLIRHPHKDLLDHHLLVRPSELREQTVYVLVLVSLQEKSAVAHLIGWADSSSLAPLGDSRFGDAYGVKASDLYPMLPVRWWN